MPTIATGSIPGPETWFVDTGCVRFTAQVDQRVIDWWDRTFAGPFDLTPLEMTEIASRGIPDVADIDVYGLDPIGGAIRFGMIGRELPDHDMDVAFLFGQSLEMGKAPKLIHNDATYLHFTYQGRRISTQLMANLYVLADRVGVRILGLEARDRGPYAWPTFGFAPTEVGWRSLVPTLRSRLEHFRSAVGEKAYSEVSEVLASPDPRGIWQIADRVEMVWTQPVDGSERAAQDTLGVALLAHSNLEWYGELNLDDRAAETRLLSKVEGYLP